MTTEKKIQKLKDSGWEITFDENKWKHIATRGCVSLESSSITNLYKSIIKNHCI